MLGTTWTAQSKLPVPVMHELTHEIIGILQLSLAFLLS